MENEFFSPFRKIKIQKLNEMYRTHVYVSAKSSAAFDSRAGQCTAREKNSFPILANSIQIFFSQTQSWKFITHVKFYFSCVCRTYKNFQLYIKWLLKIHFLLFYFVWFTQNYRYFYAIYKIFTQLSSTEFYLLIF